MSLSQLGAWPPSRTTCGARISPQGGAGADAARRSIATSRSAAAPLVRHRATTSLRNVVAFDGARAIASNETAMHISIVDSAINNCRCRTTDDDVADAGGRGKADRELLRPDVAFVTLFNFVRVVRNNCWLLDGE